MVTISFDGAPTAPSTELIQDGYSFTVEPGVGADDNLAIYSAGFPSSVLYPFGWGETIIIKRVDGQPFNLSSFKYGAYIFGEPNDAIITGTRAGGADPLSESIVFAPGASQDPSNRETLSVKELSGWTNLTKVEINYEASVVGGGILDGWLTASGVLDDLVLELYTPPVDPPVQPPVEPPVQPPVEPPVQPPVEPPVQPPVEPPVQPPVPSLGVTGQNLLQLNSSDTAKTAKFSVVQPSTVGAIEVGYFKVDDAQGNLGTLAPGSAGYLDAAKAAGNYKTIFSTLGDGDIQIADLSRMLTLAPGQFYSFFVVQGATADGLLQGDLSSSLGALTFGSPFLNQSGIQPLSFTFLETQGAYELAWDLDKDGRFDDFKFKVALSDGAPPLGAGLQGDQESELLDLRELTGSVNLQLSIRSEAFNTNVLGFFRVDNAQGTITDSFGNTLNPGDAGYLQAAAQWAGQGSVSTSAGRSFSTTVAVEGGGIWVPFMITNGTLEQLLDSDTSNDPIVFTPFLGSNPGQGDYVRLLGDNTFGFEDMVGGDFDYDDLVVKVNVVSIA